MSDGAIYVLGVCAIIYWIVTLSREGIFSRTYSSKRLHPWCSVWHPSDEEIRVIHPNGSMEVCAGCLMGRPKVREALETAKRIVALSGKEGT